MKKNILLISLSVMFFSCASQLDGISQSDKYVEKINTVLQKQKNIQKQEIGFRILLIIIRVPYSLLNLCII